MLIMELFRFILSICLLSFCFRFLPPLINFIMRKIRVTYRKIKFTFQRIYRLLDVKNAPQYVWVELIQLHKNAGRNFGQFEKDKMIKMSFEVYETNRIDFNYSLNSGNLIYRATILESFDEEITNDILVLASHFNGLLNFGVVKVSVKYNYVELVYSRDVLTYSLFPGEIDSDTDIHYGLAKDCFWSFTNLIETGEDPVFVFSELLRRKEEENKEPKLS